VRRALQGLRMPTLVVLGRVDYAVPYVTWKPLVEGLGHVRLEVLDGEGHNPQTERPQRFDPVLASFIKEK
jgi:proline iminopeptidase